MEDSSREKIYRLREERFSALDKCITECINEASKKESFVKGKMSIHTISIKGSKYIIDAIDETLSIERLNAEGIKYIFTSYIAEMKTDSAFFIKFKYKHNILNSFAVVRYDFLQDEYGEWHYFISGTIDEYMKRRDVYLLEDNSFTRLVNEYNKYGKIIVALDFDDTINDYWKENRTYPAVINLLRRIEPYTRLVICTASKEDRYQEMRKKMEDLGLNYEGINKCLVPGTENNGKVYANVYVDDRGGLPSVYKLLTRFADFVESGGFSEFLTSTKK